MLKRFEMQLLVGLPNNVRKGRNLPHRERQMLQTWTFCGRKECPQCSRLVDANLLQRHVEDRNCAQLGS